MPSDAVFRQFGHELLNVLGRVRGAADLLADGSDTLTADELAFATDLMRRELPQAENVVRLFTLWGRYQAGGVLPLVPTDEAQDMATQLREQALLAHQHAPEHPIGLALPEALPTRLNQMALKVIFEQLTQNMARYACGPGVIRMQLRDGASPAVPLTVLIEFANPTTETPPHEPLLPFSKGPGSKGAGLGLAVVQEAARALEGRVAVAVQDGVFKVTLALPNTAGQNKTEPNPS